MPSGSPSLQTIARTLGLSRTTVSDALRGSGRVSLETVKRVRKQAEAAGYRANPLVATVMGSIKRGRGTGYRGGLAVLDLHEASHWPHGPYSRELVAGAKERAVQMGFSIAEFVVGAEVLPLPRLDSILRTRGIHGIIVLPAWRQPDLSGLNWSQYAGIYTDDVAAGPDLHCVCSDHYRSMLHVLSLLAARGYKRPGLVLPRGRDERIQHRQSAAYCAWQGESPERAGIPPLITVDDPDFKTEFAPWFRRYQPDVVLSHFVNTPDWIRACAPRHKAGFVLLNVLDRVRPCAALDLQPRVLGSRAVEMVVGQILRGEFGVPQWPSRTMVQARWVDGPSVRPATVAEPPLAVQR